MPEPLKNLYNQTLINNLCVELQEHFAEFDSEGFTQQVFDEDWGSKELKARMAHITVSLQQFLPQDYAQALEILKLVSSQFEGFEYMFFPGFVEVLWYRCTTSCRSMPWRISPLMPVLNLPCDLLSNDTLTK